MCGCVGCTKQAFGLFLKVSVLVVVAYLYGLQLFDPPVQTPPKNNKKNNNKTKQYLMCSLFKILVIGHKSLTVWLQVVARKVLKPENQVRIFFPPFPLPFLVSSCLTLMSNLISLVFDNWH